MLGLFWHEKKIKNAKRPNSFVQAKFWAVLCINIFQGSVLVHIESANFLGKINQSIKLNDVKYWSLITTCHSYCEMFFFLLLSEILRNLNVLSMFFCTILYINQDKFIKKKNYLLFLFIYILFIYYLLSHKIVWLLNYMPLWASKSISVRCSSGKPLQSMIILHQDFIHLWWELLTKIPAHYSEHHMHVHVFVGFYTDNNSGFVCVLTVC